MAFTDADKAELADVQARRASGTPPVPGTAPDRARDAKRSVGPGSPNELAALGRVHERVKAERTAREADEWYAGNDGAWAREASMSTGSVKVIPKGSGFGRVVPSISGIPGRN
jgi:hypothetical protein